MAQSTSYSKREKLIRKELDKDFLPLFQLYESETRGGIPMQQLSEKLLQRSSNSLSQTRINSLLRRADADKNDIITYDEFVQQMTRTDDNTRKQLTRMDRLFSWAVDAAVPGFREFKRDNQGNVKSITEFQNCKPPPIFIPLITAAEIAVFLYYALDPTNQAKYAGTASTGCPMDSPLIYDPKRRWEVWRFLTYMFLHQGYTHLMSNCLIQLIFGILLELGHKLWRVGPVYLLGVIAGSLASSCFDPHKSLVGASGGCYALLGAYLASALVNWAETQHEWKEDIKKFLASGVFRLIVLFVLASVEFIMAVYKRYYLDEKSQVSLAAHIAGFVTGLLLGSKILKNIKEKHWETVMSWIFLTIYILLMAAGILFNVFCGNEGVGLCYGGMTKTTPSP